MSPATTIVDHLAMAEAADIAAQLHAALTAAGARGCVRVLESGRWGVRVMRGVRRQGYTLPPGGPERAEWWETTCAMRKEAWSQLKTA